PRCLEISQANLLRDRRSRSRRQKQRGGGGTERRLARSLVDLESAFFACIALDRPAGSKATNAISRPKRMRPSLLKENHSLTRRHGHQRQHLVRTSVVRKTTAERVGQRLNEDAWDEVRRLIKNLPLM